MRIAAAGLAVLAAVASQAAAQTPETAGEFWPAVDVHGQVGSDLRLLGFGGLKKGEDFPYQQRDLGVGIGYQWKRFTSRISWTSTPTRKASWWRPPGTNTSGRSSRDRINSRIVLEFR